MKHIEKWKPILEAFKEESQQLFDFSMKPLAYGPEKLSDWYIDNFENVLTDTERFVEDYPYETTTFLCELVQSDFALNFLAGSQTIPKANLDDWDVHQKLRFVRDTYESIYQNFGFITFAIDYDKQKVESYRSDWFYPHKAKDGINKGLDNWYDEAEKIVGKQYILRFSKLFQWLSDDQKLLLKQIRNSDSHYQTIVLDGSVLLLDGSESRDITDDITDLSKYLLSCYRIMYEYYIRLIIHHHIWLLPTVLLAFNEDFNFKKREVTYELLNTIFERIKARDDDKQKNKNQKLGDNIKSLLTFFGIFIYGSVFGIWNILEERKPLIDNLLVEIDRKVSLDIMRQLQREAAIEVLNIFRMSRSKMDQFSKDAEEYVYVPLTMADYDNIDLYKELTSYTDQIRVLLQKKDMKNLKWYTILPTIMSVIMPLGKLANNFKDIFPKSNQ